MQKYATTKENLIEDNVIWSLWIYLDDVYHSPTEKKLAANILVAMLKD